MTPIPLDKVSAAVSFRMRFYCDNGKYTGKVATTNDWRATKQQELPFYEVVAGYTTVLIYHHEWDMWLGMKPITESQKREWGRAFSKVTVTLLPEKEFGKLLYGLRLNYNLDKIIEDDLRLAVALAPVLDRLSANV